MNNSKKVKKEEQDDQYLMDMNKNRLIFEEKLINLKKKAKELQKKEKDKLKNKIKALNRTVEIKYPTMNKNSMASDQNR
jgi:hypothetical protein